MGSLVSVDAQALARKNSIAQKRQSMIRLLSESEAEALQLSISTPGNTNDEVENSAIQEEPQDEIKEIEEMREEVDEAR